MGLPPRTVSYALSRLRGKGVVEGPKGWVRFTPAARTRARRPSPAAAPGSFDDAVEVIFGPSPALSAFARLGADLIVVHHLYPERDFHPTLLAYGTRTGTGKTALANLLADALNLERSRAIVFTPAKSAGEIVGRRVPVAPGQYRFEAADHLSLYFVCFDELGDADADVRKRVQALCHGDAVVRIEGERLEVCPSVMATWNPKDRATVLGEPYLRRGLVLCADAPGVAIKDLRLRLAQAETDGTGLGTLRLDCLRRAGELQASARRVLEQTREVLTEEGLSRVDGRIAELATLGRAARSGQRDGELGVLAYYVGTDLLIVTETVPGLVRDDWGPQLDQAMKLWGETPELVALARAASRRVELRTAAEDRASSERNRRTQEDLALTGERATLSQELHEAVVALSRVPHGYGPRAAGLKAQLTKLREDAAVTRSRSSLAAIREAAGRCPLRGRRARGTDQSAPGGNGPGGSGTKGGRPPSKTVREDTEGS